jgi:hypothetical protein
MSIVQVVVWILELRAVPCILMNLISSLRLRHHPTLSGLPNLNVEP